jgi:hypothetical protein
MPQRSLFKGDEKMTKRNRVLLAAIIGAGFLSGCFGSGITQMSTSPTIPAAAGSVHFAPAANGNTSVNLTVKHLAQPEKLTPPTHVYVVWVRADQTAEPQNIGALVVDKELNGTLNTVTALHSFALFITAEASAQVQKPSEPQLLWTDHTN